MPREIISPMAARALTPEREEAIRKQLEANAAKQAARKSLIQIQLADAMVHMSERDKQLLRRNVAIAMIGVGTFAASNLDEKQMILDEQCIGVARYMMTGRVMPAEVDDDTGNVQF